VSGWAKLLPGSLTPFRGKETLGAFALGQHVFVVGRVEAQSSKGVHVNNGFNTSWIQFDGNWQYMILLIPESMPHKIAESKLPL
jgi:hypothetical protein